MNVKLRILKRAAQVLGCLLSVLLPMAAWAGGPKFVAGTSYFNPSAKGQPVHWLNGQVNYYLDQGPLSSQVTNQQAKAMVDAAAALWSAIPTAGVTLTDSGSLNEDIGGGNATASGGSLTAPADATPAATNYPLAVIFDADGSLLDTVFGQGTSDPAACKNNGVTVWIDNIDPSAYIAHAVMVLNGLCATSADQLAMMSFQLERGFGRVLGLDYSQVNPGALQNGEAGGTLGWPIMQPDGGVCGPSGGVQCIPSPGVLRYDDIAALNRIYPVTAANAARFPGKLITAANTISIQGTITFKTGAGMQGVNVVARPNDANGNPLYQYTVTSVSGALFSAKHGNPVTGWNDANGNPLAKWGSDEAQLQGYFDLSGVPLPPGMANANYTVSFEAVSPNYLGSDSVGPYVDGSPTPSGTLSAIDVPRMTAGSSQTLNVNVADSAVGLESDAIGTETAPRALPASGMWYGRLGQVGQTEWFAFPVRGGHTLTVVTQALDETGAATDLKALPAIGVWDAVDPAGTPPVSYGAGMNGYAPGESWLRFTTFADDRLRIGIADERGDGRPDYLYNGWVLYADTVQPQRLPASGGAIVIHGMGFRPGDTVQVGGEQATVTSISPNEITAIAPPSSQTGPADVEVDDLPVFYAATTISGGVSYDAGSGDALTLNSAPGNTVPLGVPETFKVTALGPDLSPAGGVGVTFTVVSGTATLGCGRSSCPVTATGDGMASMSVTAQDQTWSTVTASLSNGSAIRTEFVGGTPPTLAAIAPLLSVAAGASVAWPTQVLALSNGNPASGQTVAWQPGASGIAVQGSTAAQTGSTGTAVKTLNVGPLSGGQTTTAQACLNGTQQCVNFTVLGARPELASLRAVSGTVQSLASTATPGLITLRVLDTDGNQMAGATVTLYQSLYAWAPPCAPHAACADGALLTTQVGTAVSALDGTVNFAPLSMPGVATMLRSVAVTGNSGNVSIAIEQHP